MFSLQSDRSTQSAIATLELIILLVIVVLLVGAYLQGREMMLNRQVAGVENDCDSVAMAIDKYHKAYGFLPGDDPAATSRFEGVWQHSDNGDGNGRVTGTWNGTDNTSETRLFWKHLRAAKLVAGPVDMGDASYAQPINAFDGVIGVGQDLYGIEDISVVFGRVPGKVLRRFDERTDDGNANTGRVRARTDFSVYATNEIYDGAVDLGIRRVEEN